MSILITGDSHPETAINDNLLNNSQNISASSEVYFYSFLKLKKILRVKSCDTIILGVSPHNFSYFQDKKLLGIDEKKGLNTYIPDFFKLPT